VSPGDVPFDTGEAGPSRVRPYALVRGRTRSDGAAPIPVEAIVVTEAARDLAALQLERAAIAHLCVRPQSVAEVSARLAVPIGVVRVIVADLTTDGYVHVNLPVDPRADGTVDRVLLERVLAGLEAL
jgi:hypothetical protein